MTRRIMITNLEDAGSHRQIVVVSDRMPDQFDHGDADDAPKPRRGRKKADA